MKSSIPNPYDISANLTRVPLDIIRDSVCYYVMGVTQPLLLMFVLFFFFLFLLRLKRVMFHT